MKIKKYQLTIIFFSITFFGGFNLNPADMTNGVLKNPKKELKDHSLEKFITSTCARLRNVDEKEGFSILKLILNSDVSRDYIYKLAENIYFGKGVKISYLQARLLFLSISKSPKLSLSQVIAAKFKLCNICCFQKRHIEYAMADKLCEDIIQIAQTQADKNLAKSCQAKIKFKLAECYLFGLDVPKNCDKAITLFKSVIEDENTEQKYKNLAQMYLNGEFFDLGLKYFYGENVNINYYKVSYLLNENLIQKINSEKIQTAQDIKENLFMSNFIMGEINYFGHESFNVNYNYAKLYYKRVLENPCLGFNSETILKHLGFSIERIKEITKLRLANIKGNDDQEIDQSLYSELQKTSDPYMQHYVRNILSFDSIIEDVSVPNFDKSIIEFARNIIINHSKNFDKIQEYVKSFETISHEIICVLAYSLFTGDGIEKSYPNAALMFEDIVNSSKLSSDKIRFVRHCLAIIYLFWLENATLTKKDLTKFKFLYESIINDSNSSKAEIALADKAIAKINNNVFENDLEPEDPSWQEYDKENQEGGLIESEEILKQLANTLNIE